MPVTVQLHVIFATTDYVLKHRLMIVLKLAFIALMIGGGLILAAKKLSRE